MGVINGIIYVAGGNNGTAAVTTLEAYDPATNTWSTRAPMPTARVAAVGVVSAGRLYVIGGYPVNTTPLSRVEVYTP